MAKNAVHNFKIILLGEPGVGKTSMTHIYTNPTSKSNHFEANLTSKELTVKGKRVKLCIWETSSQRWFKHVATNYYDGVLLVYDTTCLLTFNALSGWLAQLKRKNDEAVTLVVGNKVDHPDSIAVSRDIAQRFTRDKDLEFMESSGKNGDSVVRIFEHLTLRILQAKNLIPNDESETLTSSLLVVDDQSDEHIAGKLQQPDTPSILTVHDQRDEELSAEQLYSRDSFTDTSHVTDETLQKSQLTNCTVNDNVSARQASVVNSDDEELELSFVWVSFLPPIVKLPSDITPLKVGRRRTSADSVLSLMTESKQNTLMISS
ncbi:ras-related protein Rab-30 [Parasteatoda tepidariorum]|uniref:ras-related protein Rab-30 n=1 Tax=Parasteatoda tepidariorum TaxID=114398 RepID=UPI00077FE417|nr:ras-related protein Rab-30 [Parasteatoda tepidariorum]